MTVRWTVRAVPARTAVRGESRQSHPNGWLIFLGSGIGIVLMLFSFAEMSVYKKICNKKQNTAYCIAKNVMKRKSSAYQDR